MDDMRTILLTFFSVYIALSVPVMAENTKTIFAVVNGVEITYEELFDIPGNKAKIDFTTLNNKQKEQLVDSLITRQLILEEISKEGFDQSESIARSIRVLTESFLVKQYMQKIVSGTNISDDNLMVHYESKYLNKPETINYRINHILLTTEEEAKKIIEQLSAGGDFSDLAKEKSKDMITAQKGGDLGWLVAEDMIPSFLKAVSKLNKGGTGARPIKTQFGWHIIRLIGKKELTPPEFAAVKDSIMQDIIQNTLLDYIDDLRSKASIEIKSGS